MEIFMLGFRGVTPDHDTCYF